jgi:hypothetical protein
MSFCPAGREQEEAKQNEERAGEAAAHRREGAYHFSDPAVFQASCSHYAGKTLKYQAVASTPRGCRASPESSAINSWNQGFVNKA